MILMQICTCLLVSVIYTNYCVWILSLNLNCIDAFCERGVKPEAADISRPETAGKHAFETRALHILTAESSLHSLFSFLNS